MQKQLGLVTAVLAVLLAFATEGFAQATGGSVIGQALDQNGAVVPNVTVTLKNEATGQTLTTQTTGNGAFSFPNTLGGEYTVTATASGFQEANEKVITGPASILRLRHGKKDSARANAENDVSHK